MENNAEVKKLPFVAAKIDRMIDGDSSLKAFATVTIANAFMVHNIKVMDGNKGLFVSMPSRSFKTTQGETKYSDICHAISAEMKQRIDAVVLKAYDIAIGQNQGATSDDLEFNPEQDSPSDSPMGDETEEDSVDFDFVPTM